MRCDEERVDDLRTRDGGGGRERCSVKKAVSRRSVGVLCRQSRAFTYSEASLNPTNQTEARLIDCSWRKVSCRTRNKVNPG